jgi:curved DNA-binding protein CbpA
MIDRPFSTFGIQPFLSLTEIQSKELHKIYLNKSLEFHPDRLSAKVRQNPEMKQEIEELSAIINADYQDLKDPLKLIDRIVNTDSENFKSHEPSKLAPDLALEYFEVIEDPSPELVSSFKLKVENTLQKISHDISQICSRFPYKGPTDSPIIPWSTEELKTLKGLLGQNRFHQNLLNELSSLNIKS